VVATSQEYAKELQTSFLRHNIGERDEDGPMFASCSGDIHDTDQNVANSGNIAFMQVPIDVFDWAFFISSLSPVVDHGCLS
jgi:hypothetical protein